MKKNIATVSLKTGRFDDINSAVMMMMVHSQAYTCSFMDLRLKAVRFEACRLYKSA